MIADSNPPTDALIADYLRGPDKLAALIAPMANELLQFRPGAQRWTIHEILLHLVDVELTMSLRIRKILAEDRPTLPTLDQNAWATRLHYHERQWRRGLQDLRRLREGNIEILRHLNAADWAREGVHPERGVITVRQIVDASIEHLDRHAMQIQENQRLFEQSAQGVTNV